MKTARSSHTYSRNGKGLSRSAKFLRALLDSDREGIVVVAPDGGIVFANRLAEELWDYDSKKMTGMNIGHLFHRQIALVDWGQVSSKIARPIRLEAVRSDGDTISLEVHLKHLSFERRDFQVFHVTPLTIRTEEEIAQEQVRVFSSLEVFAAGLAHEFNNILTGIMGNLHLAMDNGARRGRLEPTLLEEAYAATLRARDVTRELYQMSLGDQPAQGANALPQLIYEASLLSLVDSRVQIDYDFPPDLRAAFIDAAQVGQVVHQLLRFAAERMGNTGTMRVEARNFRVEPGDSGFGGELLPGDYVTVSLSIPDGGLDTLDCNRLFEPYQIPGDVLTGLGLPICRSLVRRQGGLLRGVPAQSGELRLELYLPACRDVSNQAVALLRVDVPCLEGCNVLIMDDEELVRMVLKRSLEGLGHRVTAVSDGDEAVAAYEHARSRGERFDIVFLDLAVAHGTGGKAACRELLDLDPHVNCVLISGSIGDDAMIDPLKHGFVDNLEKPFDFHEVGRVMNRLLERMGRGEFSSDRSIDEDVVLEYSAEPSNIVSVDFRFTTERC